jgi:hypothetical protein
LGCCRPQTITPSWRKNSHTCRLSTECCRGTERGVPFLAAILTSMETVDIGAHSDISPFCWPPSGPGLEQSQHHNVGSGIQLPIPTMTPDMGLIVDENTTSPRR